MSHICEKCNKNYKSSQSLWNNKKRIHENKVEKIIIEEDLKYTCKFCNKKFASVKNKWYHQNKACKEKIDDKIIIKKENKKLKEEIKKLKQNKNIINTTNNINNINTTNNINNGTIININNFNNDNIDYITDDFIRKLFLHFLDEDELHLPIPKLIKNLKFNKEHPENNNVKITSMRSLIGLKYNNEKWMKIEKEELIDDIFNVALELFVKFFKEHKDKPNFTDDMKTCYKDF
jgi:hypothetical protein